VNAELFAAIAVVVGGAFTAIAGLGVLRFGDVFMRMHASTKAGTLGVGSIMIGTAIGASGEGAIARAVLIIAFILLTAPVAAHLVGRAAWRNGTPLADDGEVIDEWRDGRDGRAGSSRRDGHDGSA